MRLACGLIAVGLFFAAMANTFADVRLPGMFSDSMVLQRDIKLPVWGWATPGEEVTVSIAGQKAITTAAKDGKWRVTLAPLKADGRRLEMTVSGKTNTIVFKDVLVGEVWLCGGQSNMAMGVRDCSHAWDEIAAANLPQIHMYHATRLGSPEPQTDHNGKWSVCSPQSVVRWTATGFFFARDLHRQLGVPVGIINTSFGGMPIRTFMSLESFGSLATTKDDFAEHEQRLREYLAHRAERDKAITTMRELERKRQAWLVAQDQREASPVAAAAPDADVSQWTPITSDKVLFPEAGIYWLRKQVEIPKEWLGRGLLLGPVIIADSDQPYLEGEPIEGGLWIESFGIDGGRWYLMRPQLKRTKLTLAIRILNVTGHPGFQITPTTALMPREMAKDEKPILLNGQWRMHQAVKINTPEFPIVPEVELTPGSKAGEPGALYNSSIFPLAPFAVRGAIWYQGEGDYTKTRHYTEALPALIGNWRSLWEQGDFPFGIVQLPNFMARQTLAIDHGWPEFREVQFQVARTVTNVGIAVTIDIGDGADAHPGNKQDVGKRLALWALANVYGKKGLNWSSPLYQSMKTDGNKIRVTFDHAAGGLQAKGGETTGFAIAGTDKVFHLAQAKIDGDSIVVWSDKVNEPVAVRYAWANNPVCNLFNKADLPAMPFRTDDWAVKEVKAAADETIAPATATN